ncbi:MAG: alpha/beta fold hydrolase [Saprospiraceae bacterium]
MTAQSLDISKGWKFRKGDFSEWSAPELADDDWLSVPDGQGWQRFQGIEHCGWGWYRKKIFIPASMRKDTEAKGGFSLHLGRKDEIDQVVFNGDLLAPNISRNAVFRKNAELDGHFLVPEQAIKWGQDNTIALRVYDSWGAALYTEAFEIDTASWIDHFRLDINFPFRNANYSQNMDFEVNLNLHNSSSSTIKGNLDCQIFTFRGKELCNSIILPFKIRRNSKKKLTFPVASLKAGIYKVSIRLRTLEGEELTFEKGLAISPENLISAPNLPEDFNSFWDSTKLELKQVNPQFRLIPQPLWSSEHVCTYLVEMQSFNNVKIRGWYTCPRAPGRYPAYLKMQGYSSYMLPDTFMKGYAVLCMNIRGHGNSRDDVDPGFPGFLQEGLSDPATYIYRGAYMDGVRAVDFLCSRAEVDSTRIAVGGTSQGGALSLAVAAIDNRIICCAPDVPFLSDFRNYFKIAEWPANEFVAHQEKTGASNENIFKTLDYFDVKNLATKIKCPVLMSVGLFDVVCPPQINFAAFNNLATSEKDKSFVLFPEAGHSLPWKTHQPIKMDWLDKHCGIIR